LVDAKTEYTNQLINILTPHIFDGILSIYGDAVDINEQCINSNSVLKQFQLLPGQIPKWSKEILKEEVDRIKLESKCDWIEDLVTAVFVSHTKILTSIKNNNKKINLKIPKLENFIHKCYIDNARYFFKNTYLFNIDVSKIERQRNRREAEISVSKNINETIRKELPVKHILREYLGEEY
jgi:hypothetical protein